MTARDYFDEQRKEIDDDDAAANGGKRKKRKKGGNVKGLTARHRMDRHVRRQVGGPIPQVGTLGAAGQPGIGAGVPAGAGIGGIGGIGGAGGIGGIGGGAMPTGAATIPPRGAGAGVIPQIPANAGALPRAGVGAANPLGGAAGAPVGGAGLGAGLGGAGIGAGVRPPGQRKGGSVRRQAGGGAHRVPANPIPHGKVLSQRPPDDWDYDAGGALPAYADPRGLTPRYHEEQHDALEEPGYMDPRFMRGVPPGQPYRDAPAPDQLRHPPVRRGSEPPLPMQPAQVGGEVHSRRRAGRRYAPGPHSEGPFGQIAPRYTSDVPSQLDHAMPPDPNGMANEPPIRQGSSPMGFMQAGGDVPAAPTSDRRPSPLEQRQQWRDAYTSGRETGALGSGQPPIAPYDPRPIPMRRGGRLPKAMKEKEYNGVKPPRRRDGGTSEDNRYQMGGVTVPRRAVGERMGISGLGRGVGGTGLGQIGGGGMAPTRAIPRSPTPVARSRMMEGVGPARFAEGGNIERPRRQRGGRAPADMEDHSRRQAGGRSPDYSVSSQAPEVEDRTGGRAGNYNEDRWGQKWAQPFGGVERTERLDRSRGQYVREHRVPPPYLGPDDNPADHTYPMQGGGRITMGQRQKLPSADFALPGKGTGEGGKGPGSYPIDTPARARNALARGAQHASPSELATIKSKVRAKYPGISQGKSGGGRSC